MNTNPNIPFLSLNWVFENTQARDNNNMDLTKNPCKDAPSALKRLTILVSVSQLGL